MATFGNLSQCCVPPPPHPPSSCSINLSKIKSRVCHVNRKRREKYLSELHFVLLHSLSFFDFLGSPIDGWYPCLILGFIHDLFLVLNPFISYLLSYIHVLLTDIIPEFYPRYYPRTLNCGYLSLFIIVVACRNLFLLWCAQSKQYLHISTYTNRRPPHSINSPSVSKWALSYIHW
jgi:hypothetical protein